MPNRQEKEPKGFKKAFNKAKNLIHEKKRLGQALSKGIEKAKKNQSKLREVWTDFIALFRMIKAWSKGDYQKIPWKIIASATAAILYFINPLDLIPDFIPAIGLIDDLSIIQFVLMSVNSELKSFLDWENEQNKNVE